MQKGNHGSHFDPIADSEGPTVYIGAQIPIRLYELINQDAAANMVHRAQIIRWALAERYSPPPTFVENEPQT